MSRPQFINKNFTPLIPYCWEMNTSDTDTGVDPEAELKYRMAFYRPVVACKPPAKPAVLNPNNDSTSPKNDSDDIFEGLLKCINAVECKGSDCPLKSVDGDLDHPDYKPDDRWGQGGKDPAIGPFQIHHDYWWDGHTSTTDGMCPTCNTHRGCSENYECAKQIVKNYLNRYGKNGKPKTYNSLECLARLHNGGTANRGCPRNDDTNDYWEKIKAACLAGKCPCPPNVGRG